MPRKITKYRRESKKKKLEKRTNLIFSLIGAALFLLTIFISFQLFMKKDFQKTKTYKKYRDIEVPASNVCMYSDEIKVLPTESIEFDGQIYFACCKKCARKLEVNYNNSRYAVDPFSGHTLQKNDSYLRLKENASGKVQYFESEENYLEYSMQERDYP